MSKKQEAGADSGMLAKSYKNIGFMMLVQVFAKIVNFSMNFLVARIVSKEVYGYANIQLQLFDAIILWFSKESVRKVVQRKVFFHEAGQDNDEQKKKNDLLVLRSAINLVHLSFYVQLFLATCLFFGVTNFDEQAKNLEYFSASILVTCLSSLVSNLSEVFYVEMLLDMDFTLRAKAEGIGIFLKGVVIYSLIQNQFGLLAYAMGELTMNCCVFTVYFFNKSKQQDKASGSLIFSKYFKVNPIVVGAEQLNKQFGYLQKMRLYMLPQHLQDLRQFSQLCFIKLILTEGEKMVIFYQTNATNEKQGQQLLHVAAEFGLIANLISLVCRFIFRPIEEISSNLFAKFKQDDNSDDKESKLNSQDKEAVIKILSQYLGGVMGIGLSAIIFSQYCSEDFIFLLYSAKWATPSAADIMRAYCIALFFMSLNGMTEAFAYGLANKTVLNKLQGLMLLNSVIYIAAVALLFQYQGMIGLIWANVINMCVRGVLSLKISLNSLGDDEIGLVCIFIEVATHRVFLVLLFLGILGTAVASELLVVLNTKLYPNYANHYDKFI